MTFLRRDPPLIPVARETGVDVTRSSRGQLIAEAVWCPTALVGPDVRPVGAPHPLRI